MNEMTNPTLPSQPTDDAAGYVFPEIGLPIGIGVSMLLDRSSGPAGPAQRRPGGEVPLLRPERRS